jgi:hypothetical protein
MRKLSLIIGCVLLVVTGMAWLGPNVIAAAAVAEGADLKWQSIAFGQSTDLNFSSTILPDKVGVNRAIPEHPGTIDGKIVLESRGGKLAAAHDGITFYYTVLDPRRYNFSLEAEVLVEQFGPETSAMPNDQTACGLMVRDVNGIARKDPMEFGYEELPAASNIAAAAVFSDQKTVVDAMAVSRNGIIYPWGNPGSTLTRKILESDLPIAKPFKLKLERTDTGFIMTYADRDGGNAVSQEMAGTADIVQVIEKDKMYVGFFAARNVKMIVSNAKLTLSPAATKPGVAYSPKPYDQFFELESSDGSGSEQYTLTARSGYDGSVTVSKEGAVISTAPVKAGQFFQYDTILTQAATRFEVAFLPGEGPATGVITRALTVEKRNFNGTPVLVAAPNGKPTAAGTADDPLDLMTAIRFVQPGGTIALRGGNYGAASIGRSYSGVAGKPKKLIPYQNEKVSFAGLAIQASYWRIEGIESTASRSFGFRVQGNGTVLERCVAHDNRDTGFQLDSFNKIPALRTSNNQFLNCDAYDNADPTMENADGFAAKQSIGSGNVYRGCVAHHNADDGWDLFNNVQNGPNGTVVIENCIAYQNGATSRGSTGGGIIGNGFKLGGEAQPVAHTIRNSLAFGNRMDGFTCNFNPGALVVENCTSFDNARFNFIFRSNPYIQPSGVFRNNLSFRTATEKAISDFVVGRLFEKNLFYTGKNDPVKSADFVSLKLPAVYERDAEGNIIWGDFLRLTPASALNTAGNQGTHLGALPALNKSK